MWWKLNINYILYCLIRHTMLFLLKIIVYCYVIFTDTGLSCDLVINLSVQI